jgi:hypothetical protein
MKYENNNIGNAPNSAWCMTRLCRLVSGAKNHDWLRAKLGFGSRRPAAHALVRVRHEVVQVAVLTASL